MTYFFHSLIKRIFSINFFYNFLLLKLVEMGAVFASIKPDVLFALMDFIFLKGKVAKNVLIIVKFVTMELVATLAIQHLLKS
jgi:hypothetical protein